jgi:hypothetical protein
MGRKKIDCLTEDGLCDLVKAFGKDGVYRLARESQLSRSVNAKAFAKTGQCCVSKSTYFRAVKVMNRIRRQKEIAAKQTDAAKEKNEQRAAKSKRRKQHQESDSSTSESLASSSEDNISSEDDDASADDSSDDDDQQQQPPAAISDMPAYYSDKEESVDDHDADADVRSPAAFVDEEYPPSPAVADDAPSSTVAATARRGRKNKNVEEKDADAAVVSSFPTNDYADDDQQVLIQQLPATSSSNNNKPAEAKKIPYALLVKEALLKKLEVRRAERVAAEAEISSADDVSSDEDNSPRKQERRRIKEANVVDDNVAPPFVTFELDPTDQQYLFAGVITDADAVIISNSTDDDSDEINTADADAVEKDDQEKIAAQVDPVVLREENTQNRREYLDNFFQPDDDPAADDAAIPDSSISTDSVPVLPKVVNTEETNVVRKTKTNVLQLEIDTRIDGIRKMDLEHSSQNQQVTWPNMFKHCAAAFNMTESNLTVMLQLFKSSGLIQPQQSQQLASTGKLLMRLTDREMAEARLLYE